MMVDRGLRRRVSIELQNLSSNTERNNAASMRDDHEGDEPEHNSRRHGLGWPLTVVLFALILLGLTTAWKGSSWKDRFFGYQTPFNSRLHDANALGIVLYPEEHISREPTTIFLQWNVSQGVRWPDGVKKQVYLVNDEFPGPTAEARSGDELEIEVRNNLLTEGVSIHWHGLHLLGQNLFDGAVGFTQCPIPPGKSFTYRIKIADDEHGTFWWHAHSEVQRGDGLFGGLVVHEPLVDGGGDDSQADDARYGYDEEVLLMIGDWFHASAGETLAWYTGYEHFGNEPVPDSMLVNGRGRFDCSLAVPARPVECRQVANPELNVLHMSKPRKQRWRIVNTGSIAAISVSVTGASIVAINVDGGAEVTSSAANDLGVLHPGERVDVVVDWSADSGQASRLFISLDPENFKYTNPTLNPNQSFPITLNHQDDMEFREPGLEDRLDLAALASTSGPPFSDLAQADHTLVVYVKTQILAKNSNKPKGFINHTSWAPQTPPLAGLPRSLWDKNQIVPFLPIPSPTVGPASDPTWVDLIINNLDDGSHPFHLHGHSFYVLSRYESDGRSGWGSYNPFDESEKPPAGLNLKSPLRKDTVAVPRRGHVVLRFRADNPGIWMLHCHVLVHLGSGMAMGLHIGSQDDEDHVGGSQGAATELCERSGKRGQPVVW